jgi:hypothetical protein
MFVDHQKEQFSIAFMHAVASAAGLELRGCHVDEDSVDAEFVGTRSIGTTHRAPRLDVQAKCTETDRDPASSDHLAYSLKMKNYDDLRDPEVHVPRVLVVLAVPADISEWLEETAAQTALRRCAYWLSLRGLPASNNSATKTVHLPRQQRLTKDSLTQIMQRIGNGGLP